MNDTIMNDTIIDKLNALLVEDKDFKKTKDVRPLNQPNEIKHKDFKPLIADIKKRFGKDSISLVDDNGIIMVVFMHRDAFLANQRAFELPEKQDWIYDKGYTLISIQDDVEPNTTKIYFGINVGAE